MKEQLSALMDSEVSHHEADGLVGELARTPEASACWQRYHLIRAALRNELDTLADTGLARAVSDRLASEPIVLAPRLTLMARASRATGGLAIAASVAALAIFGLRFIDVNPAGSASTPVADAKTGQYLATNATRWRSATNEAENDLNMYLVRHSEYAAGSGAGGMMTYVRTVGYDSGTAKPVPAGTKKVPETKARAAAGQ